MAENRVAIVSSAQTALKERWDTRQHVDLISEAVMGALRGTGIAITDVDFVIDSGSDILDGRSISNCGFLGAMGAHHKEESRVEEDGIWAALYAATKVASGSAQIGLVVAYSKPSEAGTEPFYSTQCEPFCQRPVGFDHRAASGMQAQLYMREANLPEDAFARVAARSWLAAGGNPLVETESVPDAEEIAGSGEGAPPLTRLELSRPVDGAVAMLITSRAVADRVTSRPVWITGIGTAMDEHAFAMRDHERLEACEAAASTAYRRAGIADAKAVDIVETGAGSAAGELMVMEALGLAGRGESIGLYEDGAPVSVNPSGGSLPADPLMATGLVRLAEAALQLAGRVDHGPKDAVRAIAHGTGGVGMQNHCVFTLEV